MSKYIFTAVTLSLIFSGGQVARAFPTVPDAVPFVMPLTLTSESTLELFLSSIGGSVTSQLSFDLTGSINIGLDSSNVINLSSISFEDAAIDLSDNTIDLDLGFLGAVTGALSGLRINSLGNSIDLPLAPEFPVFSREFTFDPSGPPPTEATIDEGIYTYLGTGPIGGLLGSGTLDFSLEPIPGILVPEGFLSLTPAGSVGSSAFTDVIVSVPITFADVTLPLHEGFDLEIMGGGILVATGTFAVIPEPSTLVLLGIALVALIPLRSWWANR